jgi:hypothetical protein
MELYRLDYSAQLSTGTSLLVVAHRRTPNMQAKAGFRRRQLDKELKATDVARRFVPPLGSPSHLHERGNRNRNIGHREIAAHERVRLEGTRTKDANAAVANIVNATIKFLWPGTRRQTR